MDGAWIRKVVTQEQLELIKKVDFIELRLETEDGSIGETFIFYASNELQ